MIDIERIVQKRIKEESRIRKIITLIKFIEASRNTTFRECEEFGIPRSTYYDWRKRFLTEGLEGLKRKPPISRNHPRSIPQEVIDKIIELRKEYQLGSKRIHYYLKRYHGIETSESSVYRILVKHNLNRLPKTASKRTVHSRRYSKSVPGHHVQVDVKFIALVAKDGKKVRRYQYTAIDDATRIRAIKIYSKHNQASAIDFIDYVIEKFPFRIYMVRTDRGHEFQAKFHWYVEEELGIQHVYIKPRSPQLNGKVERSHRTDQQEFYQLLSYTDDVDLNEKLNQWEHFYNFNRPHSAFDGKTPYEALRHTLEF